MEYPVLNFELPLSVTSKLYFQIQKACFKSSTLMFPSWRSLLNWKPIKMEGLRRAADGIKPAVIIDLTTLDDIQPVIRHLADRNNEVYVCPVCLDPPEEPVAPNCGHIFCKECLIAALVPFQNCPMCKESVSSFIRLYV